MFDPIQQQAGQTLLRSVANQATLGALPYPEEPVPEVDRAPRSAWIMLQVRRLSTLFSRIPSRRSTADCRPASITQ